MADLGLITDAATVMEESGLLTDAVGASEDYGLITEAVTSPSAPLVLTSTVYPFCSYEGAEGPQPEDHFTTTVMDLGTWGGCYLTRANVNYEIPIEYDWGAFSINAGLSKNVRGFSFVTPQLAAQTTAAVTLTANIWGKADQGIGVMAVTPYMAICKWLANDTKGTVYANAKNGVSFSTVHSEQTITQTIFGGITLAAGDRLAVDLWLRVTNNSGSNRNGRWGYIKWGDASFDMKLSASVAISQLQGIEMSGRSWGAF